MKKIAITIGDPGGVGPEVVVKALCYAETWSYCVPIVIGDRTVIEETLKLLKLPIKLSIIKATEESEAIPGLIELIDIKAIKHFRKRKPSAQNGRACIKYINMAVELALKKKIDAIVTAPVSKEAIKAAGFKWPGHTEMLAELTGAGDYAMMLTGGPLSVMLVTIHTPLKNIPRMITRKNVLKTIRLAKKACNMMGIKRPRIAVAGLNPHAGEAGIFGDEELKEIIPAIKDAKKEGMRVTGPYPPDTVFYKAYNSEFDIIVCMYHDQGLIPLKMIAFDKAVNVTVGLPIIRTSPDHGTAYDIAWKGIASPSSMIEAIKMAARLRL